MPRIGWLEDSLLSGLERSWGAHRLTVLAYHRIREPSEFEFFEPVISATPTDFARQMDVIKERYNAISLADFVSWMDGTGSLPRNPVLITFDDGYRDNLEHALPVLRDRELPAVLFLATEHVDRSEPFFWDAAAYSFRHSETHRAHLPILGRRSWESSDRMCDEWIEAAKHEPLNRRTEATAQLCRTLGCVMSSTAYAGEILTWDEVREMAGQGFSFGSHTVSHSILAGLASSEALRELVESRERIEDELGEPVRVLAYPNGSPADFNATIEGIARAAGYSAAFTLVPGPTRPREVRARPFAIRRIAVYRNDDDRRFRAKLAGAGRFRSILS